MTLIAFMNEPLFAEKECIPSKPAYSNFKAMPSWNDYVREHRVVAREALWWWIFYNRPCH